MAVPETKVTVKNIKKSFETKNGILNVLDGISLDVRENEFLVLFGPGQCGKTVLLNILAKLEEPDEGEVLYTDNRTVNGNVGVVFQQYAIFPWKTVLENVEMNGKFKGVPKKQRREEAMEYIRLVGLEGFEKNYPAQLSGGMKQRVGIARAYATKSDIILMDEPFGALDAQTRYQMQEEILRIWEKNKVTIVFITNNVEEALTLGDRIVLLSNKPCRVVQEFTPDLPRPRNNMDPAFLELRKEIASKVDLAL
jgi:ABC-type nitrate/sulfonate/bicarbonate transport system ATPase subunit